MNDGRTVKTPCEVCQGSGVLLVDNGHAPEGFVEIERCDECQAFESDRNAAMHFSILGFKSVPGFKGWSRVWVVPAKVGSQ